MFISCVMLQMAQIVLFMASVALDSPHEYLKKQNKKNRYNAADFCRCVHGEDAAGDDDVYLSHTSCDYG